MTGSFAELSLSEELHIATLEAGYNHPTPIQEQVIPAVIEGRDIVAAAPTGTGKSASYLLPIIQKIIEERPAVGGGKIAALVIAPTKELVLQTRDFMLDFAARLPVRSTIAFGGIGLSPQIQEIRQGTDIVIATPARAVELIERGDMILDELEFLVLDEVDRMLQMGFRHDIDSIVKKIAGGTQCLVFSATITTDTAKLAGRILNNPLHINITKKNSSLATVDSVNCHTLFVDKGRKRKLLLWLLKEIQYKKVLIFVNSKSDAERVGRDLVKAEISNVVIHGDKSNGERQRSVERFQSGKIKVMVATDIAARGFDITDLSMVVNFDIPTSTEVFVHRIGRTGRAGTTGEAYSFCDQTSRHQQERIDTEIAISPEIFPWQPFHSDKVQNMTPEESLERRDRVRSGKIEQEKPKTKEISAKEAAKGPRTKKGQPRVVQTKTGNKTDGRKAKITGKGRQKSNRPGNKVQQKRGKRH